MVKLKQIVLGATLVAALAGSATISRNIVKDATEKVALENAYFAGLQSEEVDATKYSNPTDMYQALTKSIPKGKMMVPSLGRFINDTCKLNGFSREDFENRFPMTQPGFPYLTVKDYDGKVN